MLLVAGLPDLGLAVAAHCACLSAGGRRIRTRGPSAKGKARGEPLQASIAVSGPQPVSGSALRAAVSDWQRPDEPFAGAGPIDAMGRAARHGNFVAVSNRWSASMPQSNDLSRSLVALDQNSTIIAVVE